MKKKKSGGGGANWMDTYGDMVTLLLCFFVLLYSMSTIDSDKWRAIVISFNPMAIPTATDPGGVDGPFADPIGDDHPGLSETPTDPSQISQEDIENMLQQIVEALDNYRAEQGLENTFSVNPEGGRVYIRFNSTAFFGGNSSELRREVYPILDHVCAALSQAAPAIDQVRVQGHTAQADPNSPNPVANDRTLAAMRAVNVLIYLQEHSDVDPGRLISEEMGQWHPVADNDTEEGRVQNRRVELVISGRNLSEELGQDNLQQYEEEYSTN